MEVTGFIPDGHNVIGKIHGVPRLYPDVTITYRPMTRSEVNAQSTKVLADNDPYAQEKHSAAAIKRHLIDWTLRMPDGNKAPIEEAVLFKLQPRLYERIYATIMGRVPPDEYIEGEEAARGDTAKN